MIVRLLSGTIAARWRKGFSASRPLGGCAAETETSARKVLTPDVAINQWKQEFLGSFFKKKHIS
jgi:hypothetical protein